YPLSAAVRQSKVELRLKCSGLLTVTSQRSNWSTSTPSSSVATKWNPLITPGSLRSIRSRSSLPSSPLPVRNVIPSNGTLSGFDDSTTLRTLPEALRMPPTTSIPMTKMPSIPAMILSQYFGVIVRPPADGPPKRTRDTERSREALSFIPKRFRAVTPAAVHILLNDACPAAIPAARLPGPGSRPDPDAGAVPGGVECAAGPGTGHRGQPGRPGLAGAPGGQPDPRRHPTGGRGLRGPPVRHLGPAARRRPGDPARRPRGLRTSPPRDPAQGCRPHPLVANRGRSRGAALDDSRVPRLGRDGWAGHSHHARTCDRRQRPARVSREDRNRCGADPGRDDPHPLRQLRMVGIAAARDRSAPTRRPGDRATLPRAAVAAGGRASRGLVSRGGDTDRATDGDVDRRRLLARRDEHRQLLDRR